jgi:hypothetical protein
MALLVVFLIFSLIAFVCMTYQLSFRLQAYRGVLWEQARVTTILARTLEATVTHLPVPDEARALAAELAKELPKQAGHMQSWVLADLRFSKYNEVLLGGMLVRALVAHRNDRVVSALMAVSTPTARASALERVLRLSLGYKDEVLLDGGPASAELSAEDKRRLTEYVNRTTGLLERFPARD